MDEKDCAQLHLERLISAPQPGSRWRHYKGGEYEVLTCSIKEDTLEPLVTYKSLLRGYIWTRTLDNWICRVKNGVSRFTEIVAKR